MGLGCLRGDSGYLVGLWDQGSVMGSGTGVLNPGLGHNAAFHKDRPFFCTFW